MKRPELAKLLRYHTRATIRAAELYSEIHDFLYSDKEKYKKALESTDCLGHPKRWEELILSLYDENKQIEDELDIYPDAYDD